jgi:hypothetical protein
MGMPKRTKRKVTTKQSEPLTIKQLSRGISLTVKAHNLNVRWDSMRRLIIALASDDKVKVAKQIQAMMAKHDVTCSAFIAPGLNYIGVPMYQSEV